MKKILTVLALLITLLTITSCNNDQIIPKNYYNDEVWTTSNISTYANFMNFIKYYYDEDMNARLQKNKFLEQIDSSSYEELTNLLTIFEEEVNSYNYEEDNDLKENYNIKIENIEFEDYVYLDYRVNNNYNPETDDSIYDYFMIYYFDISENILYYCSIEY